MHLLKLTNQQVINPTVKREAGLATQAGPAMKTDGPNKVVGYHLEDKSAAPVEEMDMMMALLGIFPSE